MGWAPWWAAPCWNRWGALTHGLGALVGRAVLEPLEGL